MPVFLSRGIAPAAGSDFVPHPAAHPAAPAAHPIRCWPRGAGDASHPLGAPFHSLRIAVIHRLEEWASRPSAPVIREGESIVEPSRSPDPWVWMDGSVEAAAEARVGVLDHGFLYGDSVYETLRTHGGRLFALEDHLTRLEASAAAIGLELPWERESLRQVLEEVRRAAPQGSEAGIRLVVTRGEGPLGLDPGLCPRPRLVVFGWPIPPGRHPHAAEGVDIVITSIRRNPPGALDPHIKSGNSLNNILAYREVRDRGAFEGVLLTLDGAVAECTTSNIFWVHGGEVRTPPDEGILLGVTRAVVLGILSREGIPLRIGSFPAEDLRGAGEAFITSSLKGILAVRSIDGEVLRGACPGERTRRIADLYEEETRGGG
ncbi:MAG: aminotransferase class IV [Planctomycetota bacterium]